MTQPRRDDQPRALWPTPWRRPAPRSRRAGRRRRRDACRCFIDGGHGEEPARADFRAGRRTLRWGMARHPRRVLRPSPTAGCLPTSSTAPRSTQASSSTTTPAGVCGCSAGCVRNAEPAAPKHLRSDNHESPSPPWRTSVTPSQFLRVARCLAMGKRATDQGKKPSLKCSSTSRYFVAQQGPRN